MRLVDHRLMGRMARAPLPAPIERGSITAPNGAKGALSRSSKTKSRPDPHLVAEQLIRPLQFPADRLCVGIEQQFVGIESKSGVRIVMGRTRGSRTVDPVRCWADRGATRRWFARGCECGSHSRPHGRTGTARPIQNPRRTGRNSRPCRPRSLLSGTATRGLVRSFALRCGRRRHLRTVSGVPPGAAIWLFMVRIL